MAPRMWPMTHMEAIKRMVRALEAVVDQSLDGFAKPISGPILREAREALRDGQRAMIDDAKDLVQAWQETK